MDYNENEWHISKDGDNQRVSSGQAQVPSSLLPTVLHRPGLTPEQTLSELSLDDLVAKLKNDDWEVRGAADRGPEEDGAAPPRGSPLTAPDSDTRAHTEH